MDEPQNGATTRSLARRKPFPWLVLILLLGSVYAFWILPRQLGDRPVEVEFERAK